MIKKLDPIKHTDNLYDRNGFITNVACGGAVICKINELIDTVNRHEDIIRQIGEWGSSKGECLWCKNLTEVNLDSKNRQENAQGQFAEQRKWIGKLCKFSNGDGFDEVGYLTEIDPDAPEAKFRCNCYDYYAYCEPVKPDDDIIFKG